MTSKRTPGFVLGLFLSTGVLGSGLFGSGCRADESAKSAEKKEEAPAEQKPAVDQKIASAMAAAARANADTPADGNAGQPAPPKDGIMSSEAAARELPVGGPAAIVFGGAGSAPRVLLGPERLSSASPATGSLTLSYRSGGSVMPTIDFDLKLKSGSPEATGTALAGAVSTGNGESVATRFTLSGARPAPNQPGRLPENAKAEIAKLKGSWVEFVTTAQGAVQSERFKLEGNNLDLEPLVLGSADVLAQVVLVYPDQPVGAGAFWMMKSRETANGANVLAYRMVRVESLGQTATLSVETRRYLLGDTLPTAGLPPHQVRQFQSDGHATVTLRPGAAYASSAQVDETFVAVVTPNDRPNQAVPIQSQVKGTFTLAP
jgi:hypothetical protein